MSDLFRKTIRLAHQNPELRQHLLPILKKAEAFLSYPGRPVLHRLVGDIAARFANEYDFRKSYTTGVVWLADPKGVVRDLIQSTGVDKVAREIRNYVVQYFMEQDFNASEEYSATGRPLYEHPSAVSIYKHMADFYESPSQAVSIEFVTSPRTGVPGIKFTLSTPAAQVTKRFHR